MVGYMVLSMFFSIQLQRLHSERTAERYISKFLVTGDVKSETIGRSYEETRNVLQLKKAWISFVLGVKNPQTNVHSGCIHFHARWTQLMKFCLSNSVTTVPFGRTSSVTFAVRHSLRQPFFEIAVYKRMRSLVLAQRYGRRYVLHLHEWIICDNQSPLAFDTLLCRWHAIVSCVQTCRHCCPGHCCLSYGGKFSGHPTMDN